MENKVSDIETNENFHQQVALPKERFALGKRDFVFTVLFCISAIILSAFGICSGFKVGFSVSVLLIFALITAYLCGKGVKIRLYPLVCAVLACGVATVFTITSNFSVRFYSVILVLILSLTWFVSLIKGEKDRDDYELVSDILAPLAVGTIPNLPITLTSLFTGDGERRKTLGRVFIGVLAALPMLAVIVPLLMSSDEAFSSMMNKLFGNLTLTVLKTVLGLGIALFIVSYCFTLKKRGVQSINRVEVKGIENSAVIAFLSVIAICYAMYLFSQLAYFFSAFKGILPTDYEFTVADYARRGFFEMCVISVINLVLVFAVLLFARKKEGKICAANKAICTFICIFTIIIIVTALSKMLLYIKSFGMTELRITTSAFMLFLAVVFVSVILRIFINGIRALRVAFVTAGCILVLLGTINVNSVVAKYNYNAYKNGLLEDIDINTIYQVGDEGIPYLVLLAKDSNSEVAESAKSELYSAITGYRYYETEFIQKSIEDLVYWDECKIIAKKYDGIGEYSIPKIKAYKCLDKYIEENPDILKSEIYQYDTVY